MLVKGTEQFLQCTKYGYINQSEWYCAHTDKVTATDFEAYAKIVAWAVEYVNRSLPQPLIVSYQKYDFSKTELVSLYGLAFQTGLDKEFSVLFDESHFASKEWVRFTQSRHEVGAHSYCSKLAHNIVGSILQELLDCKTIQRAQCLSIHQQCKDELTANADKTQNKKPAKMATKQAVKKETDDVLSCSSWKQFEHETRRGSRKQHRWMRAMGLDSEEYAQVFEDICHDIAVGIENAFDFAIGPKGQIKISVLPLNSAVEEMLAADLTEDGCYHIAINAQFVSQILEQTEYRTGKLVAARDYPLCDGDSVTFDSDIRCDVKCLAALSLTNRILPMDERDVPKQVNAEKFILSCFRSQPQAQLQLN